MPAVTPNNWRGRVVAEVCVVIVDPYSSGSMLADALQAQGTRCLALESSPVFPPSMKSKYRAGRFFANLLHEGDLAATLERVRRYHPTHVVPGFESGVELAEWLSHKLGLPGNSPELAAARRDKFLMGDVVKGSGLTTARQYQSKSVEALLDWVDANLDWPVVVKPPKSVASDQVRLCHNEQEVRIAAAAILDNANILGLRNDAVLVQEFLDGTEFVVDLVHCQGRSKVTGVWQYGRSESACGVGYDTMSLLPYAGDLQSALCEYARLVSSVLGIRYGPAHCEIMWVDQQPILVEVGARLTAGINAVLSRICGGISQLDETIQIILDPEHFSDTFEERPVLTKQGVNVFLSPPYPGRLVRSHGLDVIRQLPTLYSMSVAMEPGDQLKHVAGRVTLVHPDSELIKHDIAVIRQLEQEGIFEMEAAASTERDGLRGTGNI